MATGKSLSRQDLMAGLITPDGTLHMFPRSIIDHHGDFVKQLWRKGLMKDIYESYPKRAELDITPDRHDISIGVTMPQDPGKKPTLESSGAVNFPGDLKNWTENTTHYNNWIKDNNINIEDTLALGRYKSVRDALDAAYDESKSDEELEAAEEAIIAQLLEKDLRADVLLHALQNGAIRIRKAGDEGFILQGNRDRVSKPTIALQAAEALGFEDIANVKVAISDTDDSTIYEGSLSAWVYGEQTTGGSQCSAN